MKIQQLVQFFMQEEKWGGLQALLNLCLWDYSFGRLRHNTIRGAGTQAWSPVNISKEIKQTIQNPFPQCQGPPTLFLYK